MKETKGEKEGEGRDRREKVGIWFDDFVSVVGVVSVSCCSFRFALFSFVVQCWIEDKGTPQRVTQFSQ